MNASFSDPAVAQAHNAALRSIERVVHEKAEPTPSAIARDTIADLLRTGDVLVLTGAGVSTDSGIPDYRGERGKLRSHRPMTYQEFLHDPAARHRYWARSFVGWRAMTIATPNRTHFALVELERAGLINGIITQNVDGLHEAAGTGRIITVHGDMGHVVCLDCGQQEERSLFDVRLATANPGYLESVHISADMVNPDGDVSLSQDVVDRFTMIGCAVCGSQRMKPNVVYFGESVPRQRRQLADTWLEQSKALLIVGSSLAVMSGYKFALDALKQGKPVAVVNGGPGRADHKVDVLWRTGVGDAFDELLDALEL